MGYPIRTSPDHSLFDSSPKLFAVFHVLHRLLQPRHPLCALFTTAIRCFLARWMHPSRKTNTSLLNVTEILLFKEVFHLSQQLLLTYLIRLYHFFSAGNRSHSNLRRKCKDFFKLLNFLVRCLLLIFLIQKRHYTKIFGTVFCSNKKTAFWTDSRHDICVRVMLALL